MSVDAIVDVITKFTFKSIDLPNICIRCKIYPVRIICEP